MKLILKTMAVFLSVSSAVVVAKTSALPEVLCVDSANYWDGAYTVEISQANEAGDVFASVFSQEEAGRFLVGSEVKVQKKFQGTQLTYSGENFKLELQMESFAPTKIHPAELTFKYENSLLSGSYVCMFM